MNVYRERDVKLARTAMIGRDSVLGSGTSVDEGSHVRCHAGLNYGYKYISGMICECICLAWPHATSLQGQHCVGGLA